MFVSCLYILLHAFVSLFGSWLPKLGHATYLAHHELESEFSICYHHYTARRAMNLLHVQAELSQQEAQQLQEAGYFAEAAALSTTAHKWRKRAAKVSLTGGDSQT